MSPSCALFARSCSKFRLKTRVASLLSRDPFVMQERAEESSVVAPTLPHPPSIVIQRNGGAELERNEDTCYGGYRAHRTLT